MILKFYKKLENAISPTKAGENEVGYDLTVIKEIKKIGNKITVYDTGICVEPEDGYYTEIVPRSSIVKTGYILANNIGIIDPTYRGTLRICVIKIDESLPDLEIPFTKFQLIIRKLIPSKLIEVSNLSETDRGDGGFGSSDHLIINTDGGYRSQNKIAGYGIVIRRHNTIIEEIKGLVDENIKTNNVAEYISAINGIKESLKYKPKSILLLMDSTLVVKQTNKEWKVHEDHLKLLRDELLELLNKIEKWEIRWIPREENKDADKLCNLAMDGK